MHDIKSHTAGCTGQIHQYRLLPTWDVADWALELLVAGLSSCVELGAMQRWVAREVGSLAEAVGASCTAPSLSLHALQQL